MSWRKPVRILLFLHVCRACFVAVLYSRDGLLAKYAITTRRDPHQQSRTSVIFKLVCTTSLERLRGPHTGFQVPQESSPCGALKRQQQEMIGWLQHRWGERLAEYLWPHLSRKEADQDLELRCILVQPLDPVISRIQRNEGSEALTGNIKVVICGIVDRIQWV